MKRRKTGGALRRFARDESGATALEYVLIAGLVTLGIVGAIAGAGNVLEERWDDINGKVGAAVSDQ